MFSKQRSLPQRSHARDETSFWKLLQDNFGEVAALNSHPMHRLPNTLNVSFVGRAGGDVLSKLDRVAASTGAACHSGSVELSPVLKAMSIPPEIGMGAIRFRLGRTTTIEEVDRVVQLLKDALSRSKVTVC
jgi:cysteine desulfurase